MYALYGSARSSGCERQGSEDEYKPGTCEELLKWKFAHLTLWTSSCGPLQQARIVCWAQPLLVGKVCAVSATGITGPELYLLETRRDRTRGLTQLQGACRPLYAFLAVKYGTAPSSMHC